MKDHFQAGLAGAFLCLASLQAETAAQTKWSYPDCPDVTDADFKLDTLMRRGIAPYPELAEPDKLAFDMDAEGNVDVYFTEIRPGNIKRYNAKTKTVTNLVKLPVWTGPYVPETNSNNIEEGATGIALDPAFKTNGWVYIHWSPASASVFRISRFTVAANKIDLASEKIVLQFEAQRNECCHTGGAMAFDSYGDLWIAQGSNGGRSLNTRTSVPPAAMNENLKYQSEEWGSSDTHGLRGSFIRIHPDDSPRGYSIPAGNFGEYFHRQTNDPAYLDTSKVRPEVYIKGTRNNYSMALDPVRRWVVWGDVGPDGNDPQANVREELNLSKTPGFEGWPYFVGKNTPFAGGKNAAAPTNTSKWNTGLKTLPPARAATKLSTLGTAPITGPLYRYDGDLQSSVKLPPHFNRKWFVTDYTQGMVNVFTLNAESDQVTTAQRIFANMTFSGPVDFQQGPDGALYIANYGPVNFASGTNTSIMKISYKGTCRPSEPKLENTVGLAETRFDMVARRSGVLINLGSNGMVKVPAGMSGLDLYDVSGKRIWSARDLRADESFRLPSGIRTGALKYRWVATGF